MTIVSPSLSVIALNVNGLNSPIKSQRLEEWITGSNCVLPTRDSRSKHTHRLKMKGWTKIFCANSEQKWAGMAKNNIRKIVLKSKNFYKRQRRILCNEKSINSPRRYIQGIYIYQILELLNI